MEALPWSLALKHISPIWSLPCIIPKQGPLILGVILNAISKVDNNPSLDVCLSPSSVISELGNDDPTSIISVDASNISGFSKNARFVEVLTKQQAKSIDTKRDLKLTSFQRLR